MTPFQTIQERKGGLVVDFTLKVNISFLFNIFSSVEQRSDLQFLETRGKSFPVFLKKSYHCKKIKVKRGSFTLNLHRKSF